MTLFWLVFHIIKRDANDSRWTTGSGSTHTHTECLFNTIQFWLIGGISCDSRYSGFIFLSRMLGCSFLYAGKRAVYILIGIICRNCFTSIWNTVQIIRNIIVFHHWYLSDSMNDLPPSDTRQTTHTIVSHSLWAAKKYLNVWTFDCGNVKPLWKLNCRSIQFVVYKSKVNSSFA